MFHCIFFTELTAAGGLLSLSVEAFASFINSLLLTCMIDLLKPNVFRVYHLKTATLTGGEVILCVLEKPIAV